MKIDSHQHFWQLSRGDYPWMTPSLVPLYRDFLPDDLAPILKQLNIAGTIVVQAAPTVAETRFILGLAKQSDFIRGVVGWVEMTAPETPALLAALAEDPHFCGIRPMIQEISDPDWMLQTALKPSFQALIDLQLTFDALVLPQHLSNLKKLVARYPDLKIVVDHGAKPKIAEGRMAPWAEDLFALSQFPNVYCKLSGLLTEAKEGATWQAIEPYVEQLFICFGDKRLMWGSDFPVLNMASDYLTWYEMCERYVTQFDKNSYNDVFGGVAQTFYGV